MKIPVVAEDDPVLASSFAKELIRQMRAQDRYGRYDSYSAAQVIDPFVLTKERKRALPVVGNPGAVVLARLNAFYNAIATLIEQHSGRMAAPVMQLSPEGFGRVLIIVGKLAVLDRSLRDVHRFGFRSTAALQEEGDKRVEQALTLINDYPALAE
ncbi:MAG: NifX-associated nitrogen fixation protein [Candidatus Competibacteraceae bacterium]